MPRYCYYKTISFLLIVLCIPFYIPSPSSFVSSSPLHSRDAQENENQDVYSPNILQVLSVDIVPDFIMINSYQD